MLRTCWRQKILVTLFVKILFSKKKSKTIFSYHALDYKMVCQRVLFLHALLLGTIWNILLFMNHKSLIKGAFNGWFNLILPSLTIQWNAYLVKNQIFGPVLSDRHNSSDRRVPLFRFVKAKN